MESIDCCKDGEGLQGWGGVLGMGRGSGCCLGGQLCCCDCGWGMLGSVIGRPSGIFGCAKVGVSSSSIIVGKFPVLSGIPLSDLYFEFLCLN